MSAANPKKLNQVHIDENWRCMIRKEVESSKTYDENWGYLKAESSPVKDDARETRRVKYFSGKLGGPGWTVKEMRLPPNGREELSVSATNMLASTFDYTKLKPSKPTTSDEYGRGNPLEVFGVAKHGLKGTITKVNYFM